MYNRIKIILIISIFLLSATGALAAMEPDKTSAKLAPNKQDIDNTAMKPADTGNSSMKAEEKQNNSVMVSHQESNAGEDVQIKNTMQEHVQSRLMSGDYVSESGRAIRVMEQENNQMQLKSGDVSAHTVLKLSGETADNRTRLWANLSNGMRAEVKVMPDSASETALQRLRLNVCSAEDNCSIVLKEVADRGNQSLAYEIRAQKESRLFGIFKKEMPVEAQVSAENGQVIQAHKPWWAFLATE